MSEIFGDSFALESGDEHTIHGTDWRPKDGPRAVIQLLHGLGEYHERYTRFARLAAEQGYAVVAHDHRGHGAHATEMGYLADRDGWGKLIEDSRIVAGYIDARYGKSRRILLGHSMGSYVAQAYTMRYPDSVNALVLSASTWPDRKELKAARWLARLECVRLGRHGRSPILHKKGFGNFNKPFEPARTALDWLSRDERQVDAYIADPLCGGPFTNALWADLTAGLQTIADITALQRIPADMPILLTGGSNDPIGGVKGISLLARRYKQMGHVHVTSQIYDGGRHEMFHELNRDKFMREILAWIEKTYQP